MCHGDYGGLFNHGFVVDRARNVVEEAGLVVVLMWWYACEKFACKIELGLLPGLVF